MMARSDHIQMVCDNYQLREDDSQDCGYRSKDHSFDQNIQNHFLADPRTGTVYCFIHKVAIMSVLPNCIQLYWSRRLACTTRGGRRKQSWPLFWPRRLACAMRSLAIVITIVQSLFLSLSSVFCFLPTSGNLPCAKICFPQYFGITRRYMQNKYIFLR